MQNRKKIRSDHSVKPGNGVKRKHGIEQENGVKPEHEFKLQRGGKGGGGSRKHLLHVGTWILNYGPEQYTLENYYKALTHLQDGTPFGNTNTPPGPVYRPWTIEGLVRAHENGEPTILDGDWD